MHIGLSHGLRVAGWLFWRPFICVSVFRAFAFYCYFSWCQGSVLIIDLSRLPGVVFILCVALLFAFMFFSVFFFFFFVFVFSSFSIVITSLGEEKAGLCALVDLFVYFAPLIFVLFLFLLLGCGL